MTHIEIMNTKKVETHKHYGRRLIKKIMINKIFGEIMRNKNDHNKKGTIRIKNSKPHFI